jgi:hypothetical protein
MKRAVIASILGIVASLSMANKTQAQGNIYFANYNGNPTFAPVTFASGVNAGENVGSEFSADLLYSFGANLGVTYSDLSLGTSVPFYGSDGGSPLTDGAGLFGALTLNEVIPSYTSGAVDFIVEAYNGSSYSAGNTTLRGQSSVITLSVLATAGNGLPTGDLMSDNSNASPALSSFTVSPVPEPTTLALAGLGGAALLALRRKKA